jgi:hypothetical protein
MKKILDLTSNKGKEKGQDQIDLALRSCNLMNQAHSDERNINLSSRLRVVNSQIAGMRSAILTSGPHSLKMPLAGVEPASPFSSEWSFSPLSYRGTLSNKSTRLIYNQNIIDDYDNVNRKIQGALI